MNAALQPELLSAEDYLAGEDSAPVRHEYLNGTAYAMAGGSDAHNSIALNLAFALRRHLQGKGCKVYMAEVKARVLTAEADTFYYPDVMVTCDVRDTHPYYKQFPKLVIEVLSESTERIDRAEKSGNYTQLDSLEEYVLVAQDRIEVTVFRRETGWKPTVLAGLTNILKLQSVGLEIPLSAIYEGVR